MWLFIADFTSLSFKHLNQSVKVWAAASRTSADASSRRFKTSEKNTYVTKGHDQQRSYLPFLFQSINLFCNHWNYSLALYLASTMNVYSLIAEIVLLYSVKHSISVKHCIFSEQMHHRLLEQARCKDVLCWWSVYMSHQNKDVCC